MALTDVNSPHVLTHSRLTEEELVRTIARGIHEHKEIIEAGRYPEAAKKIARDVNVLYARIFIDVYHKGLRDGVATHKAIDFSLMEKQIKDYETEHGEIQIEPLENPVG